MFVQCDKCGETLREVPVEAGDLIPEGVVLYKGFHIVLGGEATFLQDGTEGGSWIPHDEFDLCDKCRDAFQQVWESFLKDK